MTALPIVAIWRGHISLKEINLLRTRLRSNEDICKACIITVELLNVFFFGALKVCINKDCLSRNLTAVEECRWFPWSVLEGFCEGGWRISAVFCCKFPKLHYACFFPFFQGGKSRPAALLIRLEYEQKQRLPCEAPVFVWQIVLL